MTKLRERHCAACVPGTPALDAAQAGRLLTELAPDWAIAADMIGDDHWQAGR